MVPRAVLRPLLALALLAGPATALAEVGAPSRPAAASTGRPTVVVSWIGGRPVAEPALRLGDRSAPQGLSGDGRLALFTTDSGPSTDDNGVSDVYLTDRRTGAVEGISVGPDGRTGDGRSSSPSISADGRFVAFVSSSRGLDGADADAVADVFVRDRRSRTTRRVSRFPDGSGTGTITSTQISADGRSVLWTTTDGLWVRHLPDGAIQSIAGGGSFEASLSGDGAYVAYARFDGAEPVRRVRVADRATDVVSTAPDGTERAGRAPQISHTGQVVSFTSDRSDIRPGGTGGVDLYVRDLSPGGSYFRLVAGGASGIVNHVMSGDGLTYALTTGARLLPADVDTQLDVYAATVFGGLQLVTEDIDPARPAPGGRGPWWPELSGDGLVAAVVSDSPAGLWVPPAPRVFAVAVDPAAEALATVERWFPRLFGRPMTAAERDARLAQLVDLGRTGAEVVVDDLRRESFSGPRAGVVRLYQAYFLRPPDTAGYEYWVARRRSGTGLERISQDFAASAEFRRLYGTLGDRQFVERVYLNVLGRAGDAAGIAYWTTQLTSRARTRGQVMTGFSESPENRERTALAVDTIMLFHALHGAVPGRTYLSGTAARGRVGLGTTAELRFIAAA